MDLRIQMPPKSRNNNDKELNKDISRCQSANIFKSVNNVNKMEASDPKKKELVPPKKESGHQRTKTARIKSNQLNLRSDQDVKQLDFKQIEVKT